MVIIRRSRILHRKGSDPNGQRVLSVEPLRIGIV